MTLLEPRQAVELFGHDEAATKLAAVLASGRIPHGWLFSGPRGIGKATLAWRFARALLGAEHDARLRSAPTDRMFRMVASGGHPDLHLLEVEPARGKRAVIKVDQARNLKEQFASTAGLGGRRVLIVDAVDDLNPQSANAILKLLEEPPPETVLLLVNHVPGRILPTIASRCVRLRLRPLDDLVMTKLIAEALPDRSPAERSVLVPFARGSIGKAIWLDSVGFVRLYQDVLAVCGDTDRRPSVDRARQPGRPGVAGDRRAGGLRCAADCSAPSATGRSRNRSSSVATLLNSPLSLAWRPGGRLKPGVQRGTSSPDWRRGSSH